MSENPAIIYTQQLMDATVKLDVGEPFFLLKSRDVTASLMVETWVAAQQLLRSEIEVGTPIEEAVRRVRVYLNIPSRTTLLLDATPKDRGAMEIARQMSEWKTRKVAD